MSRRRRKKKPTGRRTRRVGIVRMKDLAALVRGIIWLVTVLTKA